MVWTYIKNIFLQIKKKIKNYSFLFFCFIQIVKSFIIIGEKKENIMDKIKLLVIKAFKLFE